MSTYKNIHGKSIKSVSTNLSDSNAEGQIWFNTTDDKFKSLVSLQAWSSTSNMSTARVYAGSNGTQTAALIYGGYTPSAIATTEEYSGSGFSSGGALNTARRSIGGAGTQTAGLAIAGYSTTNLNKTEEYDGSSWTESGNYPVSGHNVCGIGTQTAALACGQANSPLTLTNEYGGSSWTSGGALNTGRSHSEGAGTQTAGLTFTGDPGFGSGASATESYDGSSWTTLANVNTARADAGGGGSQTSAIVFGGRSSAPTNTQATENWNGTSWSTSPATIGYSSSNGIGCANQPGSDSANVSMGGSAAPGSSQATNANEYNSSINVVTAGAWSSGAALPGVRWNTSGTGTQTAGFVFGGSTGPSPSSFLNTTFEYNGSSWTAGGTNPLTRINQFGAGIQTATIGGGGYYEPGGNTSAANTYDGSSWTGITATPVATKGAGAAGTSTACLIYGSDTPDSSINQDSYYWNGSSWAEEGALNASFQNGAAGGPTENTAFKAGSLQGSPETSTNFETYNGSAWTAGPSLMTSVQQNRGFGSSTECFSIGGYNKITPVEKFNGTAWETTPSLATGRKQFASANFTAPGVSNGWVGGGADGDSSVEHFTEESTSLNVKDLTQSS